MTDDQDETEMRVFTRELFAETDETADADEGDPVGGRGRAAHHDRRDRGAGDEPGKHVLREGSNPAPPPGDDLREFARQLFAPDQP